MAVPLEISGTATIERNVTAVNRGGGDTSVDRFAGRGRAPPRLSLKAVPTIPAVAGNRAADQLFEPGAFDRHKDQLVGPRRRAAVRPPLPYRAGLEPRPTAAPAPPRDAARRCRARPTCRERPVRRRAVPAPARASASRPRPPRAGLFRLAGNGSSPSSPPSVPPAAPPARRGHSAESPRPACAR